MVAGRLGRLARHNERLKKAMINYVEKRIVSHVKLICQLEQESHV